jgi:hypothetical protein
MEVGAAAAMLAVITLWVLKWIDVRIPREHRSGWGMVGRGGWPEDRRSA